MSIYCSCYVHFGLTLSTFLFACNVDRIVRHGSWHTVYHSINKSDGFISIENCHRIKPTIGNKLAGKGES